LLLKLVDLRNGLSKGNYEIPTLHEAAGRGRVDVFEKLWNWDINFLLKPEELRNKLLLWTNNSGHLAWKIEEREGNIDIIE
jgi:hypothetical protein